MKISHLLVFASFFSLAMAFTSCEESKEENEYHDWKARNEHFIDSIADVASKNVDGNWLILKAHTLGDDFGMDQDHRYYVYAQAVENGEGEYQPVYNDSVRVHYSGRLIPSASYPTGYNFDKSYSTTTLDVLTDVPTLFCPNQLVVGFATAVMHMVEGDRWKVYIPSYLAYGEKGTTGIPKHSALVYDIQLARIYKYGIDKDTSWHAKRR